MVLKVSKPWLPSRAKSPAKDLGDEDSQDPLEIDFDKEYTEYNLNPDTHGADLRHEFEKTEYRVMLVANKFQTGFNQPKLVAMYLDKKISDVEAVQTLSRLNRTYRAKTQPSWLILLTIHKPFSMRSKVRQRRAA